MDKEDKVYESYSRACVKDGRYICLALSEPGKPEIHSVKIIGRDDDPAYWLVVANDLGRQCVVLFEFDKRESLSFGGINCGLLEAICHKLANLVIASPTRELNLVDWKESLSQAEITLVSIIEKRGTMMSIHDKIVKAISPIT